MTIEILRQQLEQKMEAIRAYVKDNAPSVIGQEAINDFKDNFANESFNGKKWQEVKRRDPNSPWYGHSGQTRKFSKSRTEAKILEGETKELQNSISARVETGKVIITNETKYAKIHNEGFSGTVTMPAAGRKSQTVKEHKRKTKTGKIVTVKSHERKEHRVDAYSRKLQIPKRQFIGVTKKLEQNIIDKVERDLNYILKK